MNRKVLSALLASAFAGVATTASAGVIQASYKNYASEVFGTNAVVLTAPTINYALALPLSGTNANPNSFTISWTLTSGGTFVAAPALANIALTDPSNNNLLNPSSVSLSADSKTLSATFTVATNYTVGSQIVLGSGGPVQITNVGTILGAPALTNGCGNDVASVLVAVKLTNAAGVEFDSNFNLAPLSNTTPIVQASVALSVTAKDSATYTTPEKGRVDVLIPSLGKFFTNDGDVTLASTSLLNIGQVSVKDKSVLFDLNGTAPYSSKGPTFGTNPNTGAGVVEANALTINVAGAFQTAANGGSFFASLNADCTTTLAAGTIAADGKSATVTLSAANVAALAGAPNTAASPVNLCYASTNANVIPVSQFMVTGGSLGKYANSLEAANPVCPSNIYNLQSNGVRVDVRNYLPGVVKTASGWYTILRVINTDPVQTVSPVVQALLANGTLGASSLLDVVSSVDGKSGPFKPNEVRYYTSDKIDAALNAAATASAPTFGANDVGGNARLRITAPSSSIRIQNYIFNPSNGNFVEASGSQGDDGPDYNRAADATNK
ncbi:MAG: hypothetical protein KGN16_03205 [Burkholderiales bacterium]|nr:hypothetical protein [Burkholderiales bacterium]